MAGVEVQTVLWSARLAFAFAFDQISVFCSMRSHCDRNNNCGHVEQNE